MLTFFVIVELILLWVLWGELRKTQGDVKHWRNAYKQMERMYLNDVPWHQTPVNNLLAITSTVVRAPYDSPTNVPAYVSVDPGTYYEQENTVPTSEKSTTLPS